MKQYLVISMVTALWLLAGCANPEAILITPIIPTLTLTPILMPECHKPGTLVMDRVLFPDSGDNHGIAVYLPPCYSENPNSTYPVLYWTNGSFTWRDLFDTTDRLIGKGDVPAFIIVLVQIDPNKGFGADAQIINYVVPYTDSHYRTQPDRLHRSITGFSNGAAIAIRAAFQAPDIFSHVAVLSGGIADGEQEKFTNWVSAMPPDQRPEVLINVGDDDPVGNLTRYLIALLDKLSFPYTYIHAPGGHTGEYLSSHIVDDLKWLMSSPQDANK